MMRHGGSQRSDHDTAVPASNIRRRDLLRRLSAIASFAAAAAVTACSPARLLDAFVPQSGYRLVADRRFREGPRGLLDLYLSEAATAPMPIVVFLYGGNWRSGERRNYRFVGQALASRGFAVAIPDYRLFPEVRYPLFLEDNAGAFAWVAAHAREFGLDPARLTLMGHSAGAYNAAMLALDRRWLGAAGLDPRRDLSGFIGLAGAYDFLPLDADVAAVLGSAADPRETQPINFVAGGEAPMLLATGLDDTTVRPRNTLRLAEAVRAHGGRVELKTYPGLGHIRLVADIAAPLQSTSTPVIEDVVAFLRSSDRLP
jgi:acetyl esterase/lipase